MAGFHFNYGGMCIAKWAVLNSISTNKAILIRSNDGWTLIYEEELTFAFALFIPMPSLFTNWLGLPSF